MKETGTCPKCGCEEIAANIEIPDYNYGAGSKAPQKIVVDTTPQNLFFKGTKNFGIRAWVCTGCGFLEHYLQTPPAFAQAHREGESNKH